MREEASPLGARAGQMRILRRRCTSASRGVPAERAEGDASARSCVSLRLKVEGVIHGS